MADDQLAGVQARELARRGALGGLAPARARAARGARRPGRAQAGTAKRRPCERTRTPSTQPPSRCSVSSRTGRLCASSALARPDGDGVGARVGRSTYSGSPRADAEAVALADGVGVRAAVLAEHAPARVDDRPRARAEPAVALEEVAVARAGEEAQILRVGLARDRQAGLARASSRTCGLRSSPSGKRRRASDAGASAEST